MNKLHLEDITMAEATDVARLVRLAAFARNCSAALFTTMSNFQSQPQVVRDVIEETGALADILQSLEAALPNNPKLRTSILEKPLKRCAKACHEFEKEIQTQSSSSEGETSSFRGWTRLRYIGEDIDGFRRLLSAYKLTIIVVLTDASISSSYTTTEAVEGYSQLLRTAKADLESRLDSIDSKLESLHEQGAGLSDSQLKDVAQIKEERRSMQNCLQICTDFSAHIAQLQPTMQEPDSDGASSPKSKESDDNDVQYCRENLSRLASRAARHEEEVFKRLFERMAATDNSDETADGIGQLRKDWKLARESMEALTIASRYLNQQTDSIENFATGDAVQFIVSTEGKTLRGKNSGLGWRARQACGYMNDDTVRQLSTHFHGISFQPMDAKQKAQHDARNAEFSSRFGGGYKLTTAGTKP